MKIGVCVKEVPDTATKIELTAGGDAIDKTNVKFVLNPYDEFAIEEALRHKDKDSSVEVVILSVGPQRSTENLRKALAMGADRALHCVEENLPFSESFVVASTLKAMAEREAVDCLFMGKQAVDDDCYQTGPMLAALLDWPQAMNIIELKLEGETATAVREVEGGRREILELSRPFVVGVTKGINEARYASLKGIMAAKKKEITTLSLADLNVDLNALKSLEVDGYSLPPERGSVKMIEGEPGEQAKELVRLLREEAKVL